MVDFKQILTEDNTEPNTAFLNQLRDKLPEFFTKDKYDVDDAGNTLLVEPGRFDMQKFQDSLQNHNVNEITDGYTLNFVGKKYAELQTGKPTPTVVIPDMKHNSEPKNAQSENVFLTGDNLDALKHLQRAYTNSIDVIYIDPPYNTGKKDDFVYNDKFDLSDEDLRDIFNMSEDEIKKLHLLNGRSSHSAWLTFMYPRLKMAQQLLKDSGVIFVSIDDNEQANLKLLMDDVFGEGSFLANIVRKTTATAKSTDGIGITHDYIIVYGKSSDTTIKGLRSETRTLKDEYFNERGFYDYGRLGRASLRYNPNQDYPIEIDGFVFYPGGSKEAYEKRQAGDHGEKDWQWRWTKAMWEVGLANGFYANSNPNSGVINVKSYERAKLSKNKNGYIVETIEPKTTNINSLQYNNEFLNQRGSTEVADLIGQNIFSYPKPAALPKLLIKLIQKSDALILDFFAGSSTTADAVMQLNAEDGGTRKWILNTLDEKTPDDSAAYKAGYLTIDEISRERIKRSGEKIQNEHPEIDSFDEGFKHYYVKEMNANTIDKIVDFDPNSIQILTEDVVSEFAGNSVKLGEYYEKSDKDKLNPKFAKVVDTGASGEDTILQTWLINDGYKLGVPVKTIELVRHNVHYVEDGAMAYIIDQFTQDDVEALLNLIGTQKLNVKTIIVFGYSFDFATMISLKNNVKTALDGVRVEVRY